MKFNTLSSKKHLIFVLVFFFTSSFIFAEDDFKWEFGVGVAGISIPHYLGSDETLNLVLPLPYGTYEDKKTQVDRDGVDYNLFGINDLDLSFSVTLGLPVNSEDNKAREGMNDLNTLLEVGPAINYSFVKNTSHELSLVLPLRGVFSFDDLSVSQKGVSGSIDLEYTFRLNDWELNGVYGINYADKKYHSLIYAVDSKYVTEDRAYFSAKKGIASHTYSMYLSRRWNDFYFGFYARKDHLEHAANRGSPLVKSMDSLYASFYFGWIFAGN